jgi:hypothetical protein
MHHPCSCTHQQATDPCARSAQPTVLSRSYVHITLRVQQRRLVAGASQTSALPRALTAHALTCSCSACSAHHTAIFCDCTLDIIWPGENKKHVFSSAKKTRKKTCFMAAPVIVAKKHTMHLTKTQRKKQPSSLVLPLQTLQNTLQLRGLTPKCTFCAQKNSETKVFHAA